MENLEFRIWDNQEKKWRQPRKPIDTREIQEETLIAPNGKIWLLTWRADVMLERRLFDQNERFEISQSIGRSDSKGVKAFTGDIVSSKELPAFKGRIDFKSERYCVWENGSYYGIPEKFTIIGNKW